MAVLVKGLDGAIETLAGLLVAITGPWRLYEWIIWSVAPELEHKLGEHASRAVQHGAGQLALSSTFAIAYLLSHGALKLALAIGLLRERTWIFPAASAVLLGFVVYLAGRAAQHNSIWLLVLALFDAVTLALVLNEWRNRTRAVTP